MADPIRIAVTFKIAPELMDAIRAVDPRVQIVDYPAIAIAPRAALSDEEQEAARRVLGEVDVVFGPNTMQSWMLDAAKSLKWMQVITAGVDQMVQDGILDRGFVVTKANGLAAPAIAEYVMGTMLMLCKGLHIASREQQEHKWQFRFTSELKGKTVGIIGMGAIGREVAKRARPFGLRVLATRRRMTAGEVDPDCDALFPHQELVRVLQESDYVVLCVPLTDETRGMVGAAELAVMKPTASLINIARGSVVDQEALIAALNGGTIASAALDVFDPEPLPADSRFWDMPNVIVTPHMSGAVEGYGHRATELFIANLRRFAAGEPLENVVDRVLAY